MKVGGGRGGVEATMVDLVEECYEKKGMSEEALKMYKWVVRGESMWARQVTTLLPRRIKNLIELVIF
ncbi:hypothetical protein Hanom_Chr05g00475051 [Helianthus anomalus]